MKQAGGGPQESAVYIAVEGATGIGKTTLATKLSARLGVTLALDPFERNPALTEYCQGTPAQRAAVAPHGGGRAGPHRVAGGPLRA